MRVIQQKRNRESESDLKIRDVVSRYLQRFHSRNNDEKNTCLQFLDENAYDLFANVLSLRRLSRSALIELITRDTFFAKEYDIFNAVLQWRCGKKKTQIRKILTNIRWNLITFDEFKKYVKPSNLISEKDYMRMREKACPNRIPPHTNDDNSSSSESCAESDTECIKHEVIDISETYDNDSENEEQKATNSQEVRNDENDRSSYSKNSYGDCFKTWSQNATYSGSALSNENDSSSNSKHCSNTESGDVIDLFSDEDDDGKESEELHGNRVGNADVGVNADKSYGCNQCSRKYRQMTQLDDHFRAHEVNFTCPDCGKRGFSLYSSIWKHKEEGRCDLQRIKNKYIEERQRTGSRFVSDFMSFIS